MKVKQENWRHIETGEYLEYETIPGSNLSICPHGEKVAWADECDECMREYN